MTTGSSPSWIGGGLMLFSFLILPIFIVYGYFMNVVRESTAESPQVPKFEEWGDLFVDGLKVFVIGFVYMIIPTAVFAFTVLGTIIAFIFR
ncbi:MAG: DUF4013 domain-containing protein [Natrialbaceae archaeon]|nr:DUF4013 domain-containing protein [Natrialbaceae archaeon]